MKLSTQIEGLDNLGRAMRETPKVTRALLRDVLAESVEVVARVGKTNVPRDQSDLYNAINFEGRGLSWRAGVEDRSVLSRFRGPRTASSHVNPSVYGRFVEYGTRRTSAHPFMRPAAETERARLPGRLRTMATKLPRQLATSRFV